MRIAEVIAPRRSSPRSSPQAADYDIREAAVTMADYLESLKRARFMVYGDDLRPIFLGDVEHGRVRPANLEDRLLEPTRKGYTVDVEILEPVQRWLTIVLPPGGGPAKRVVRWRTAPKAEGPWLYGVDPARMQQTVISVGDLIAAASHPHRG